MRQVTITIPDEHYDDLLRFLKPIPNTVIDNSEEEYNLAVQKMILDRIKNAKPEDYMPLEDAFKELDKKWL